jgi:hypothetical protein
MLPKSLGSVDREAVDWIPADKMVAGIFEQLISRMASQCEKPIDAFHFFNPQASYWSSPVPAVEEYCKHRSSPVKVVDCDTRDSGGDWKQRCQRRSKRKHARFKIPTVSPGSELFGRTLD